ncbi:MAG: chemotaxis protein CheW [Deltaproteobacteria bacterium]|nr:chemotaxis protein CheW [Deltaproteobacteria bacterium]MBW1960217.1 chemotaxis protein CheW [Deltaproteobacteria bacterium]MBW2150620.1 chemotaxis protein CheW [Deltaproteobacteria bacterium]
MTEEAVSQATQYLTFTLGDEDFALEIGKVREVLDYTTITKVPGMPAFLSGVINLRGNVVPVIDLRLKLGMSAIKRTVDTCIVIVEVFIEDELTQMGALADSVKEVIDLDASQISPPPRLSTKLNNDFIKGMGKQDEKFLIILDIDRVLSSDELEIVRSAEQTEQPSFAADNLAPAAVNAEAKAPTQALSAT